MAHSDTATMTYLQALARDKTAGGREALTNSIGELYLARSDDLSAAERALVGEILRQLIVEVEVSVRHTLARRLSTIPSAPRDVVLALANDVIDVARPLLVQSTVLTDPDLIEIIRNRSEDHQMAVAVRKMLSANVSEELVATDSTPVILTLLQNPDAEISAQTMHYLVEQSRRVAAFQQPLVTRRELTQELAGRLYVWAAAKLKAHLLEHFKIDPLVLASAAAETVSELTQTHPVETLSKEDLLAERLMANGSLTPTIILQALRDAEIPLFFALFSAYLKVAKPVARRVVADPGGEVLCISCKASGIDRTSFASIYLLTRKIVARGSGHLSDMAGILSLYDRVGSDAAAALLKKWQSIPAPVNGSHPPGDQLRETLPHA
jgi:uncharacterized protein (DUF2336 family)